MLTSANGATLRILYVQYTNPAAYPPVEHSARILADAGADVLLLGTENQGHELRLPPHDRIRMRLMPFQSGGWRQKLHYLRFTLWALGWALRWRPSWVYASDPLSCPVALLIARATGVRVAYHEHDSPMPGAERDPRTSFFMRMVLRARRSVGRSADLCILPTDSRGAVFREAVGRDDVLTVWNCPSRLDVAPARPDPPLPQTLRVWFHGSIVPPRALMAVIDALARLPAGVTLAVAGYETIGHPGYVRTLAGAAAQLGVADRVTFLGPMNRRELLRVCAGYDVGLTLTPTVSTDINEREMVGASNKPFDYLACGLAVLVSDLPQWRAMYVDPGFGLSCVPETADSIADALRWFLEHPAETRAMGDRGRRQVADHWNYESTFAPVLDRMIDGAWPGTPAYAPTGAAGRS